jgi:hypothetical protein
MADPNKPQPSVWHRPLTRRQTLLAYFAVGWVAVFVIEVVGDYQLMHRLPSIGDLGIEAAVAVILAPLFAWLAALKSAGLRKRFAGRQAGESGGH